LGVFSPWSAGSNPLGLRPGRTSRWQECVEEDAAHLMVARKQRKRGGGWE
jgi:hypothetical protein